MDTGQRIETGTGLYDYGARWYDPAIGRFLAPDPLVPEPGNPQALNRYMYVLGNPLRFTDPTGHFTEEEICTYWGYCSEEQARIGLGERLFKMLWRTAITWGDLLFIGDEHGVNTVAMFVLMAYEQGGTYRYQAGLWGVSGERYGRPVQWSAAQQAELLAAYNAQANVWEGMSRTAAEAWVGQVPAVQGAKSLGLAPGVHEYQFATYVDLSGLWWTFAGITLVAGAAELGVIAIPLMLSRAVGGTALAVDIAGLAKDALNIPWLPGGPVDATYPVVYYDPLRLGRAPYQLHFEMPGGWR